MIASFLLFLALIALSVTVFSVLQSNVERRHVIMALWGLSMAIYLIGSAVAIGDLYFDYPHLSGIGELFFVLLPVLSFLLIKESLGEQIRLRDGLHILPFILYGTLMMPFYLMSASQKVRAYDFFLELNVQNVSDAILPGLTVITLAGYGLASQGIITSWQKKIYRVSADPDLLYQPLHDSLRWIMWAMIAMVISLLFLSVQLMDGVRFYILMAFSFSLAYTRFIWSIMITQSVKRPEWIQSISVTTSFMPVEWPEYQDEADLSCTSADEGFMWKKEDPQLSEYEIRQQAWHLCLDQSLKTKQWWSDPDLNIVEVSQRIGLSVDLIHRLLAERERCTFFDYINRMRVEAVKKRIAEFPLRKLSIETLAIESGFKNEKTLKDVFSYYAGSSLRTYQRLRAISISR